MRGSSLFMNTYRCVCMCVCMCVCVCVCLCLCMCVNVLGYFIFVASGNSTVPAFVDPVVPEIRSVFQGIPVSIPCSFGGFPEATGTWCRDVPGSGSCPNTTSDLCPAIDVIEGIDVVTLFIAAVERCHNGTYRCVSSNALNPAATTQITLNVLGMFSIQYF